MVNEPEMLESISTRLYNVCLLLDGTKERPGVLEKLGGDVENPGLIDQAYRAGTRLEELSESVRSGVVADVEQILGIFGEGEQQDKLVESLRHRLAAMVDTETQRAMGKHLQSLDATAQEVLKAARWTGDQLQNVLVRLSDFDEALDDQFDSVRKQTEAFGESVNDQQVVLQERLEQLMERLEALKEIDTTQIQIELQGAVEETARGLIADWTKEHQQGLRDVLEEHREASTKELNQLLEGQAVFLNEGVAKSRRMVAKAIEGKTYQQTLDQLTEQVANSATEITRLKGELRAAQRGGASARGRGEHSLTLRVVLGGVVASGLLSGGVVAAAILYAPVLM